MTGADLARRFDEAVEAAIRVITGPARAHWQTPTEAEGWPVGVTARHIGLGNALMQSWAESIRTGTPVEGPDIHAVNADVAAQGVVATPDEVAVLLRTSGRGTSVALATLTDDDLDGEINFSGRAMPRRMLAEASIRHIESHLGSIRAVIDAAG